MSLPTIIGCIGFKPTTFRSVNPPVVGKCFENDDHLWHKLYFKNNNLTYVALKKKVEIENFFHIPNSG
ncbi:MAG: hypothetical protein KME59_14030 [Trichormus sp. ATA11-4-KO1]|jgi:hypothetical protein|nr:hypothetical protein [Trichormus sp. ATA11-4-KO1]